MSYLNDENRLIIIGLVGAIYAYRIDKMHKIALIN
jgi:hypothetical protein